MISSAKTKLYLHFFLLPVFHLARKICLSLYYFHNWNSAKIKTQLPILVV